MISRTMPSVMTDVERFESTRRICLFLMTIYVVVIFTRSHVWMIDNWILTVNSQASNDETNEECIYFHNRCCVGNEGC